MKRDHNLYLKDVLNSIETIEIYLREATQEQFLGDFLIQDAVARRLEIIGEATKSIPEEVKKKYPEIPWQEVAGLRNVLAHEYFGVNWNRVWLTLKHNLPPFKKQVEKVFKELSTSENHTN